MVRHRIFNMNLEHDEKPQRIWTPNQYQPLFVLIVAARPMVASDKCWLRMAGWERGHVRSHDHNSALVIFSWTHDSFKESSRDVFNHIETENICWLFPRRTHQMFVLSLFCLDACVDFTPFHLRRASRGYLVFHRPAGCVKIRKMTSMELLWPQWGICFTT